MEKLMAQPIIGKVEFKRTADGKVLLIIDPDVPIGSSGQVLIRGNGQLTLGGNGAPGQLYEAWS
jgi:hypothetical protein